MKHIIKIFKMNKETGKYFVDNTLELDTLDIEIIALKIHKEQHDVDEERYEYTASLDKTES